MLVVEITANDGEAIANELIRGEIHGLKTDENGAGLEWGCRLACSESDESEFTAENTNATATSAGRTAASSYRCCIWKWVLKELESPEEIRPLR
ncbi:MAG: hypothetical protein ACLTLQ_10880 [[Clostridium] scindens]